MGEEGWVFLVKKKKRRRSNDWVEASPRWLLDASLPVRGNRCGPNGSPGTAAPLEESLPERQAGEDGYIKKGLYNSRTVLISYLVMFA